MWDCAEDRFNIRTLLLEKDSKQQGKFWVWMNVFAEFPTIIRIDARLIANGELDPKYGLMPSETRKEHLFMGFHCLKAGENRLPPLPLQLDERTSEGGALVDFGVISQRHFELGDFRSEFVGPFAYARQPELESAGL